jgi:hypothetical protein
MVPQVAKLLRKERLSDATLCKPAREVVDGILGAGEADLGGGLFKKRLPRPGAGKSGGFRAIVAYRPPQADRILITYAFAKNAASTLTPRGHEALRKVAQAFVAANGEQVSELLASGDVSEVRCDASDQD